MSDDKKLCAMCRKKIYATRQWAASDARALNRKKRQTGHMEPYRCPWGFWHVGKKTSEARRTRRMEPSKRWRWRQERQS